MNTGQVSLFISHSASDRELVALVIKALKAFYDFPDSQVRCTSLPGYQFAGGADIVNTIRSELREAAVVLGVITPYSLRSPWVLCELGAVWGMTRTLIPALAGLNYKDVHGPLEMMHCWRFNDFDDVHGIILQIGEKLQDYVSKRHMSRAEEDNHIRAIVDYASNYNVPPPSLPVDRLYRLHLSSDSLIEDGNVFQDFDVSRAGGSNVNAVHFLWADTFTNSSIRALICKEGTGAFLRVWFENGERTIEQGERAQGWASNVKIKPAGDAAFRNYEANSALRYSRIKFRARVPQTAADPNDLKEVGVAIRILDRRLTYWEYSQISRGGQPSQFFVDEHWREFEIDLVHGGYGVFNADGNHMEIRRDDTGRPRPDFTIIGGLTFSVGSYSARIEEPGMGRGVVDFGPITFG